MGESAGGRWVAFADVWREREQELPDHTWQLFCSRNVAFGEEMARRLYADGVSHE